MVNLIFKPLATARRVGNNWNFVGHLWNYTHFFERWKLGSNKYNDRLRKFPETSLTLDITDKICLNYEILRTETLNLSPEIFWKLKYEFEIL